MDAPRCRRTGDHISIVGDRVPANGSGNWISVIRAAVYTVPLLRAKEHMAVFYIGTYDIVDPTEFQKYPPVVLSLVPKYGGVVLASDTAAVLVEGTKRTMNAIIRFPSKEAALGLYNDPDYQEAKRIRQASTRNVSMVLVEEFKLP
jgi:uncharacterized protein (DUF1330 family)